MSIEHFYRSLPALNSFLDIANSENFTAIPDDWYIVITDIRGSTKAIESGYYREVNLLGACSITAILNLAQTIDLPFVFGGDGATILLPPALLIGAREVLAGVQALAKESFGMDLRVGIVPVAIVTRAGYEVRVARLATSQHYSQAVFTGGGLNHATELVKRPATARLFNLKPTTIAKANLTGLECRWQDIPSRHGEVVSLLVQARAHNYEGDHAIYQQVLEKIRECYGEDDYLNPVVPNGLRLSFSSKKLSLETRLRAKTSRWLDQKLYLHQIRLENLLGFYLMKLQIKLGEMPWGLYRQFISASTDYQKFDDGLRMTFSGTVAQRQQLVSYLEEQCKAGRLVYGLHYSDRALMTCLVFERHGRQVHFIDGAEGGYAVAAKRMKQQSGDRPSTEVCR
jgi:hypothetical protein